MIQVLNAINASMRKFPRSSFACGIFLCLAVGVFDALQSSHLNFSVFYLIPVLGLTWISGRVPGLCLAAISIALFLLAEKHAGRVPTNGWNELMLIMLFVTAVYLVDALARALEREQKLSRHDFLTKAYNAKAFYEILEVEAHRCRRYNRPLTIAYIDCDDFKKFNDRFGHHRGDELLKTAGGIIHRGLRLTDIFARLGGDEFAVILPETHNRDAKNIFLRIRKALSEDMIIRELNTTFSVGVATFLSPPVELDGMIQSANALMHDVKKTGKDMVNAEVFGASNFEKGQP